MEEKKKKKKKKTNAGQCVPSLGLIPHCLLAFFLSRREELYFYFRREFFFLSFIPACIA